MKRIFLLCLSLLLLLSGCVIKEEAPNMQEKTELETSFSETQDPTTEYEPVFYREDQLYLEYLGLKIYKTEESFVAAIDGGGTVVFSEDGTLLKSGRITPVDGSNATELIGKAKEDLLKAYGEAHCDTASGVECPTYITEQCTILAFNVWGNEVGFLTVTNILTKETNLYGTPIYLVDEDVPPVAQLELLLSIEDGCVISGINDWVCFVDICEAGRLAQISIRRTYEGKTYESTLVYDGVRYTLSEEDMVRSYGHLIYSCQDLPAQSKYDFAEYYLLTDDPEMTMDRYFDYMVSSVLQPDFPATTVIYTDYMNFDRAETFGIVPDKFAFKENLNLLQYASFGKEGFYCYQLLALSSAHFSSLSEGVRKCYNYKFEALEDDALPEEDWDCMGYYKGKQIFRNDKLFDPGPTDRLPVIADERGNPLVYGWGVFDNGEGYILVRMHQMGRWKLNPSGFSHCPSYRELIITAYDAEGTPLWQTTSDIFVS